MAFDGIIPDPQELAKGTMQQALLASGSLTDLAIEKAGAQALALVVGLQTQAFGTGKDQINHTNVIPNRKPLAKITGLEVSSPGQERGF